jgi:hypothetical protein
MQEEKYNFKGYSFKKKTNYQNWIMELWQVLQLNGGVEKIGKHKQVY